MKEQKTIFAILGLLFIIWFLGMLLPIIPLTNAAQNQTVQTRVNVSYTEPHIYNVTINPSPIALNPGTTTNVTCNGTVTSYNGVPVAIANVTAYLFFNGTSPTGPVKNATSYFTYCYNVTPISSSAAIYSCDFNVWYYARNGTWICNMTPYNYIGLNTSNDTSVVIQPLIAINVTDMIDYGIVPVLNISGERTANITNFGNVPINISVRGWGGDNESLYQNLSMVCEFGNISVDMERYNLTSGLTWANMINLTDTNNMLSGLVVPYRNDTFTPINRTYWRIKVPTGVGGICNGTVLFTASNN